ncbi:MAG: hypothetical protein ACRD4V_15305 [Candidatus Acidiferrales bacterium]
MNSQYLVITIAVAAMAALSGARKLRRDPKVVHVVHEVVGVPLKYFPHLAGCLFAGAWGWFSGSGGRRWESLRVPGWSSTLRGRLWRTCASAM